jgi:hypothetical protein
MRITTALLLAGCLALPACQRSSSTNAAPEKVVAAERDRSESLIQGRLDDFDHRFDGLEARMKGMTKADRERLKTDVDELRQRKGALERKFKDMKGVSDQSWRELKESVNHDLDQLELAYNVVAANNNGEPQTK